MARSYAESAAARRARWSPETLVLADQAAAMFRAEVEAHRSLGEALLAARKEARLTQAELEAKSSVQQPEISKIERGVGNPTIETLIKLSSALDMKIALVPDEHRTPQHA